MVEEVAGLLTRARGAYQREQYQEALAYFRKACQADTHSPEALLGLGEVASFLDLRDEAVNAFLGLADIYLRASMLEVASEVIERILELEPSNGVARRFQRFINSRIRASSQETSTAVTVLARPASSGSGNDAWEAPTDVATAEFRLSIDPEESGVHTAPVTIAEGQSERPLTATSPTQPDDLPFQDTMLATATRAPTRGRPPSAEPRRSSDPFADVSTRLAPEGLMEEIAQSGRDPFDVPTVAGDLPSLLARRTRPDYPEGTRIGTPPPPNVAGSGSHDVDHWDLDTAAAVVAENVREKPSLAIDDDVDDLDPEDFPELEDAVEQSRVTGTIFLPGADIGAVLKELVPVSPLLAQLTDLERNEIALSASVEQCFAGQVVCRQGDRDSSLYLLISGQVAVEGLGSGSSKQRVAALLPGAFFGEGSLLAGAPRSSTVRIIEDSVLLELSRSLIQRLARNRPQVLSVLTRFLRTRMVSSLMMSSPLFLATGPEERRRLAPLLHLHKLNVGEVVVRANQLLTGFCTLMAGTLEVYEGELDKDGARPTATLGIGDCFGADCIAAIPSPVGIVAATACWLMRLPTEDLRGLVGSQPGLLLALRAVDRTL
jgi:CRP-like cAMP-binding protein